MLKMFSDNRFFPCSLLIALLFTGGRAAAQTPAENPAPPETAAAVNMTAENVSAEKAENVPPENTAALPVPLPATPPAAKPPKTENAEQKENIPLSPDAVSSEKGSEKPADTASPLPVPPPVSPARPAPVRQPPAKPARNEPRSEPAGQIRFHFRYAPWKDVIEWFADQAALSLQADNLPAGTLNLTDGQYYTPTEALDILNSYLLFKEYSLLRKGKTLFVVYLPDGIPPNLLEPIAASELDSRGKYEICRCVFNLNRTTPEIIQAEAEKLLGPQGSIVTLPKSQQIVITETGGTLRAVRDIIKRIDDPEELVSGAIHIIETKNLSADEALGIMRKLLAVEESDSSLRTAADISGTKIWMSGRGDMIERAKDIIRRIDDSYASKDTLAEGQPQFSSYDTGSADPSTVLSVLQTLLAGTPDVRLSLDTKTGGVAVLGRPAVHATVQETVKQMQLNVPQIEVIPLKRISPASAVESIKKFFAVSAPSPATLPAAGAAKTVNIPPPTVEADITARQILVRGTVSQIAEIRALLLKLGEDGTAVLPANLSPVRMIPLSPAAAPLVLEQLQSLLPKLAPNIKVIAPEPPKRETERPAPVSVPLPEKKTDIDTLIDETFDKKPVLY